MWVTLFVMMLEISVCYFVCEGEKRIRRKHYTCSSNSHLTDHGRKWYAITRIG